MSMTLAESVTAIAERWVRGLDLTSTGGAYGYGLTLRVLPVRGHLPVTQITGEVTDATIDARETRYGTSTIKNSCAPLVRMHDETVRDGLIRIDPARNCAKHSPNRNALPPQRAHPADFTSGAHDH